MTFGTPIAQDATVEALGDDAMSIADTNPLSQNPSAIEDGRDQELAQIREALRGLRFGTVSIIVQDGVVVQIDRTEKRRVRQAAAR
jgi:hypothetical protein